jgi:formylglycine-generating enzyme required for sulfatase activity
MSGNVWEWCSDKYSSDYNSPRNSMSIELRGGNWDLGHKDCRVTSRTFSDPYGGFDLVGFRLCRTLNLIE